MLTVRLTPRRSSPAERPDPRGRGASKIHDLGQGRIRVSAHNRDALRALIAESAANPSEPLATSVEVSVTYAKPPVLGWIGQPGISVLGSALAWNEAGFSASIDFVEPTPVSIALAAVIRMCTPIPTGSNEPDIAWQPAALPRTGLATETLRQLAVSSNSDSDPHLRFTDVLIASEVSPQHPHGSRIEIQENQWASPFGAREVYVDPLVHRPFGRRSAPEVVTQSVIDIGLPEYLDTQSVRSLKDVTVLTDTGELTTQQRIQLQSCGLVLADKYLDLDAPEANAISVAGRSLALRHHTAQPLIYGWPSVSMVLVTNRPEFLHRIVEMLAQQTYPVLELVLLTHGFDLDEHIASHLSEFRFPAIHQVVPAHMNLGEALISGSSLASGDLLTKIDDDDFYGPEHVWDLVTARMYSGAQIVGKALDHIYLASQDRTVFRPTYAAEKYANFVAGGTMMISQGDLRSVGGWRPVPKSVDRALLDRVVQHGGLIYRTHGRGYIYVRHGSDLSGEQVNTSVVADSHFETKTQGVTEGLDQTVLADYGSAH